MPTGLAVGLAQRPALRRQSKRRFAPTGLTMAVTGSPVPLTSGARELGWYSISGAEAYTKSKRTSVNLSYSAGMVTFRPEDFAAASAS